MGLLQYLGTDGGSHAYINPCEPDTPAASSSSSSSSPSAPAPTTTTTHLCDLAFSSLEEANMVPGHPTASVTQPWSCMQNLDGRAGATAPSESLVPAAAASKKRPSASASAAAAASVLTSPCVRTRNYPLSSLEVQFHHLSLRVTHYALYVASFAGSSPPPAPAPEAPQALMPRSWRLEGSNVGLHWNVIDERTNDDSIARAAAKVDLPASIQQQRRRVVFAVPQLDDGSNNPRRYSLFRLVQTDFNSAASSFASSSSSSAGAGSAPSPATVAAAASRCHVLCCWGVELFGGLGRPVSDDPAVLAEQERAQSAQLRAELTAGGGTFTIDCASPDSGGGGGGGGEASVSAITPGLDVPLSERGLVALNRGGAKWRAIRVEYPMLPSCSSSSSSSSGGGGGDDIHVCSFEIQHDPATSNSWRWVVGVVSEDFAFSVSPAPNAHANAKRAWVGAQQNSWGYIAGTGGICHESGTSTDCQSTQTHTRTHKRGCLRCQFSLLHHADELVSPVAMLLSFVVAADGSPFGVGDLISVRVDLSRGSLEFAKNGVWQGVAFTNLPRCTSASDPPPPPLYFAVSMHAVRAQIKIKREA